MDYSEKWGVDVDEAVELALADLKLTREEVDITVLEQPSKGFFGIGSKLAKVRVEKKKADITADVIEKAEDISDINAGVKTEDKELKEKSGERPKERKRRDGKNRKNKNRYDEGAPSLNIDIVDKSKLQDTEQHEALDFIKNVTEKMGLKLDIKAKTGEDMVYIEMSGEDAGTIIGKRGQTLDSIQYLTSLVINKNSDEYIKVVIDAENYRSKRQKTLEQLAHRLAGKVARTGRYVRLEPMNPYERKIIHATLQGNPDVYTRSEGDEPYRRVIIELKK